MTKVGIEKLRAYVPSLGLDLVELAEARGVDPAHPREDLLTDQRAVMAPWEDSVTMAVNAARGLLTDEDRDAVELLLVATETGVDLEKPISSWVHRYLELPTRCRNLEVKHACYSGTGALKLAASYLTSAFCDPGAKALVITTDASLVGIGEPYEYILGAGATAALVSRRPDFLALHPGRSGVYAQEVTDVIRPTGRVETGNSETSLFSYLEAVDGAFDALEEKTGALDFAHAFAAHLYHAPFGGITFRAHKRVLGRSAELDKSAAWADFARRVLPSLTYARRIGGTYGGSLFFAMLALARHADLRAGDDLCVFSYGSGSCAEAYTATLGPRAAELAVAAGVDGALAAREMIDVATYERLERERAAAWGEADYTPPAAGSGAGLVLHGVSDYVREYTWS